MTRIYVCCTMLGIALCACSVPEASTDDLEVSSSEQAGISLQGISLQGISLQGISLQGMNLQGYRFAGATLEGVPLRNVRVVRGELVAERGSTTLRGTELTGALLDAQAKDLSVTPPAIAIVEYRIKAISPELSRHDPTETGDTFLYDLEQWSDDTGTWMPACEPDEEGRRVAIPLAAIWNERGDRVESRSMFTFGCTTGVIAKCYRWGYRPWVTGYGNLTTMHQTCTRLARADYCGNGTPHTRNGTMINVWDRLPAPGPIQRHDGMLGLPPPGMLFEAGWDTGGAVCLSHSRWLLERGLGVAQICPSRLLLLGLLPLVCDTVSQVLGINSRAMMFNEAYLNVGL